MIPPIMDIALLVAIAICLAVVAVCADYCCSLISITVIDVSMGFPKNLRTQLNSTDRPQLRWSHLGMCRVGGIVTNRLFAAALDDGVAFELRSVFGRKMMNTFLVPWQQLRLEVTKENVFSSRQHVLHVVSSTGDVLNSIELGDVQSDWLARVARHVESYSKEE